MPDYFALLSEPRRPWLDAELLKQKFLALSSAIHPDHSHQAGEREREAATRRFAEMNAAWQCLREPRERIGHLLELESGARPADTRRTCRRRRWICFLKRAGSCREADAFSGGAKGKNRVRRWSRRRCSGGEWNWPGG
jgi:curved DNA-binding protein CbpA